MMAVMPEAADAQVKFGVRLGANMSRAYIDKRIFVSDNRTGFVLGPTLDVKIPVLGLGFDLSAMYDYKTTVLDASEESGLNSGTKGLHCFDIPLNIKWTVGNDKAISVYAAMGPQISWNIGGQSLKGILDTSQYTMRSSMFSWNLGAGFTFLRRIRLSYNYNIGIGETAEVNFINSMGDAIHGKMRNNTHQFFLTYFF